MSFVQKNFPGCVYPRPVSAGATGSTAASMNYAGGTQGPRGVMPSYFGGGGGGGGNGNAGGNGDVDQQSSGFHAGNMSTPMTPLTPLFHNGNHSWWGTIINGPLKMTPSWLPLVVVD